MKNALPSPEGDRFWRGNPTQDHLGVPMGNPPHTTLRPSAPHFRGTEAPRGGQLPNAAADHGPLSVATQQAWGTALPCSAWAHWASRDSKRSSGAAVQQRCPPAPPRLGGQERFPGNASIPRPSKWQASVVRVPGFGRFGVGLPSPQPPSICGKCQWDQSCEVAHDFTALLDI